MIKIENSDSKEDSEKRKSKSIKTEAKQKIRRRIEELLELKKGNACNEKELIIDLLEWLISLHNELDLGNNNLDVLKLFHEVYNEMYCEYLPNSTSKRVRLFAVSKRVELIDTFVDYIGFKW